MSSDQESRDASKRSKTSFWNTVPGIITAVSGLIGAIATLLTVLHSVGWFPPNAGPTAIVVSPPSPTPRRPYPPPPTPTATPTPSSTPVTPSPPEKPMDPISIDGRVLGCDGTRLIDNALVRLQIASIQEEQQTDSDGRYSFSVQGFDPKRLATMSIDAQGFYPLQLNQPLAELKQQKVQHLVAQPGRFRQTVCQAPGEVIGGISEGGKGAAIGAGAGAGKSPANTRYAKRSDPKQIVAH